MPVSLAYPLSSSPGVYSPGNLTAGMLALKCDLANTTGMSASTIAVVGAASATAGLSGAAVATAQACRSPLAGGAKKKKKKKKKKSFS